MAGTQPDSHPPDDTEVEVSIFGPGLGEALAVHLGRGDWLLVDSCLNGNSEPASLAYLKQIGVATDQVRLVVASHWHDDHVGGLAEIVSACPAAEFAYSGALHSDEFFTLVDALSRRSQTQRSGISEFARIAQILEQRKASEPMMAIENRRLWSRNEETLPVSIDALSPCDGAVLRAQRALAAVLPKPGTGKRAIVAPRPNHASVVLWVSVAEVGILLGADLEETGDPKRGWTAILDRCHLAGGSAAVFKIPHHGSANADQPRVWEEMLECNPWALMTPFVRGRHRLPGAEDKRRIQGRTNNAYLTADSERHVRKRSPAVESVLELVDVQPVLMDPPMGQVRLRAEGDGGAWRSDLFGPAFGLAP